MLLGKLLPINHRQCRCRLHDTTKVRGLDLTAPTSATGGKATPGSGYSSTTSSATPSAAAKTGATPPSTSSASTQRKHLGITPTTWVASVVVALSDHTAVVILWWRRRQWDHQSVWCNQLVACHAVSDCIGILQCPNGFSSALEHSMEWFYYYPPPTIAWLQPQVQVVRSTGLLQSNYMWVEIHWIDCIISRSFNSVYCVLCS